VYPVHGKVTLRGKPLVLGLLLIGPVGQPLDEARQFAIDAKGAFSLRTYSNVGEPDGYLPGTYSVAVVSCPADFRVPPGVTPDVVPEKYGPGSTKLTLEVKPQSNEVVIALD
jgi:hypothetical protein